MFARSYHDALLFGVSSFGNVVFKRDMNSTDNDFTKVALMSYQPLFGSLHASSTNPQYAGGMFLLLECASNKFLMICVRVMFLPSQILTSCDVPA